MYKASYEQYIGRSKEERREKISASPMLERKRFFLTRHPEIRERLKKLQEVIKVAKSKYPEFVSIALFGSLTKGYAVPKSDLDAYIIFDEDRASEIENHDIDAAFLEINENIGKALALNHQQRENLICFSFKKNWLGQQH